VVRRWVESKKNRGNKQKQQQQQQQQQQHQHDPNTGDVGVNGAGVDVGGGGTVGWVQHLFPPSFSSLAFAHFNAVALPTLALQLAARASKGSSITSGCGGTGSGGRGGGTGSELCAVVLAVLWKRHAQELLHVRMCMLEVLALGILALADSRDSRDSRDSGSGTGDVDTDTASGLVTVAGLGADPESEAVRMLLPALRYTSTSTSTSTSSGSNLPPSSSLVATGEQQDGHGMVVREVEVVYGMGMKAVKVSTSTAAMTNASYLNRVLSHSDDDDGGGGNGGTTDDSGIGSTIGHRGGHCSDWSLGSISVIAEVRNRDHDDEMAWCQDMKKWGMATGMWRRQRGSENGDHNNSGAAGAGGAAGGGADSLVTWVQSSSAPPSSSSSFVTDVAGDAGDDADDADDENCQQQLQSNLLRTGMALTLCPSVSTANTGTANFATGGAGTGKDDNDNSATTRSSASSDLLPLPLLPLPHPRLFLASASSSSSHTANTEAHATASDRAAGADTLDIADQTEVHAMARWYARLAMRVEHGTGNVHRAMAWVRQGMTLLMLDNDPCGDDSDGGGDDEEGGGDGVRLLRAVYNQLKSLEKMVYCFDNTAAVGGGGGGGASSVASSGANGSVGLAQWCEWGAFDRKCMLELLLSDTPLARAWAQAQVGGRGGSVCFNDEDDDEDEGGENEDEDEEGWGVVIPGEAEPRIVATIRDRILPLIIEEEGRGEGGEDGGEDGGEGGDGSSLGRYGVLEFECALMVREYCQMGLMVGSKRATEVTATATAIVSNYVSPASPPLSPPPSWSSLVCQWLVGIASPHPATTTASAATATGAASSGVRGLRAVMQVVQASKPTLPMVDVRVPVTAIMLDGGREG
jgi:hypothetical protein